MKKKRNATKLWHAAMFKNRNATISFRANLLNPPQNSHKAASVVLLNPRPVPVNHSMGQELRSSPKRRQLAATSTAGAGCSAARPPLGWHQPNVKPPLLPEYQLSTCQKDSEEEPLTEVLFALLFYFFFIYQVSLPARTWYLKIEGLCDSPTVSVTGSHHVLLLELGLRLSNRNSGKLNVTAEWAFSKEGS